MEDFFNLKELTIQSLLIALILFILNFIIKYLTEKLSDHYIGRKLIKKQQIEAEFEAASYDLINALSFLNSKIKYIVESINLDERNIKQSEPQDTFMLYDAITRLLDVLDKTDAVYKKMLWYDSKAHKRFHRVQNDLRKSFSSKLILKSEYSYDNYVDYQLIIKLGDCKQIKSKNEYKDFFDANLSDNTLLKFLSVLQNRMDFVTPQNEISELSDRFKNTYLKLKIIQVYVSYYIEILDPECSHHRRINYLPFSVEEITELKSKYNLDIIFDDIFEYRKQFYVPRIYSELFFDFSYRKHAIKRIKSDTRQYIYDKLPYSWVNNKRNLKRIINN